MTAWSIETGFNRSYAASRPDALPATVPIIVISPV